MKRFSTTKCLLAAAVALAIPSMASAAVVGYTADKQITYAREVIKDDAVAITVNQGGVLGIRADTASERDLFTTTSSGAVAFRVYVTLAGGAKFDTGGFVAPTTANVAGGQFAAADLSAVGAVTFEASDTIATFTVTVDASKTPVVATGNNVLFKIPEFKIKDLLSTLGAGGNVGVEIRVHQVVSPSAELLRGTAVLAKAVQGVVLNSVDYSSNPERIDVSSENGYGARSRYSPSGDVGDNNVPGSVYIKIGEFAFDVAEVTPQGDLNGSSPADSDVVDDAGDGSAFTYPVGANDNVTVVVGGTNFSPWLHSGGVAQTRVWLDTSLTCARTGANTFLNASSVASANDSLTFVASAAAGQFFNARMAGAPIYICFGLPEAATTDMIAQGLNVNLSINFGTTAYSNPGAFSIPSDKLLNLKNNGTTNYFHSVSPGDNPRNDSILRLVNNGTNACPVTIDARADNGDLKGPLTLTVAGGGVSVDIPSAELENGNSSKFAGALGGGQIRWQLRTTAECGSFDSVVIQRNFETGTLSNLHAGSFSNGEW